MCARQVRRDRVPGTGQQQHIAAEGSRAGPDLGRTGVAGVSQQVCAWLLVWFLVRFCVCSLVLVRSAVLLSSRVYGMSCLGYAVCYAVSVDVKARSR